MDGLYLDLTVMSSRTSLNRTPSHMNTTNTAPAGSQPGTGARSTRSSTRATDTGSVTSGDGGLAGMTRSFFGLNRKPRRNSASSGSSGTPPPPPGHPFNAARTSPRGSQSHPQTGLPPQGPTGQPSQASQSQASFPQSTHSTSQQSQQSQQSASQSSYSTSTSSSLPRTQSIPSSTNHPSHTGHSQGAHTQPSTGAHSTPGPHSGAQPRASDPRSEPRNAEYEPLETPRTPTSATATTVSAQGGGSFWWAASQTRQWHLNEDILLFRHVERNGALNWDQAVPGRTAEEARIAW